MNKLLSLLIFYIVLHDAEISGTNTRLAINGSYEPTKEAIRDLMLNLPLSFVEQVTD